MATRKRLTAKSPEPPPSAASEASPPEESDLTVVGIGASAGGLEAMTALLNALPARTGLAYVFVQHLDPQHESSLVELLSRGSRIPVEEAKDGARLLPDHLYVIPPNASLTVSGERLALERREPGPQLHLAVDALFRSLASGFRNRSIGVVLSGTGSDGTLGLRAIKEQGGLTFAQSEASAKFAGMPQSAVAAGAVDFVYSPREIARELERLATSGAAALAPDARLPELLAGDADARRNLFSLLRSTTGVDFSGYKPSTLQRRIARRMAVRRAGSLGAYVNDLREHPEEVRDLFDDLLIVVTSFFRDPEVFDVVGREILPKLTAPARTEPLRLWVPGCATGEEAYSLGILLAEAQEKANRHVPFQIFGTDLSERAIEHARRGVYAESAVGGVTPERLERFFLRTQEGWQVGKSIREACIFARHDLARDPPFSAMDLVSCRNVLIYMEEFLQKRLLQTFHYALRGKGFLVLGTSESAGVQSELFDAVDKKARVYRSKQGMPRMQTDVTLYYPLRPEAPAGRGPAKLPGPGRDEFDLRRETERVLLKRHVSPSLLVNARHEVLEFYGDPRPYLDPAGGPASLQLSKLLQPSLLLELHPLLAQTKRTAKPARKRAAELLLDGEKRTVTLEVVPLGPNMPAEAEYLLIALVPEKRPAGVAEAAAPVEASGEDKEVRLRELGAELAATKESLRSAIQEHEAMNEELRSALEELQSNNEELQSTNEELETAREELQSANEELRTVNEELQKKNELLNVSNSDLMNLLGAVALPEVLLDPGLRIRRFTALCEKALGLIPSDVGRPFSALRLSPDAGTLPGAVEEVLDTLSPKDLELRCLDGRWYSVRIRVYRTEDNRIGGAVLVFFDIDVSKKALLAIAAAKDYAEAIVGTVREPLLVLDGELRVESANAAFYRTFRTSPEKTVGGFVYELEEAQWDLARLRTLLEEVLPGERAFDAYEMEATFARAGRKRLLLNGRQLLRAPGEKPLILLALHDLTGSGEEGDS
ncbi:MAG: PAS domain-containing protein [Deltaproteobacteria bacterium]|nr:PAS domain-containing protein [Deltaproteobacteria bacterium]